MPKKITEDTTIGDVMYEWKIPEYKQHNRGPWWIIIMSTLGLILIGYGIWTGNFLFTLVIMLAGIVLFLQHHEDPIKVPFAITSLGIVIGNKFYSFNELDAFFIIYEPPEVKKLFFETDSKLKPLIAIPLKDQNPVKIRHYLRDYLPEDLDKEEEPLSETISRHWKLH